MTTANVYFLQLPDPDKCPARSLKYGFDSYVVAAAAAADAAAFVEGIADSASWGNSNLVTPVEVATGYLGTPNMNLWSLRVTVYDATSGLPITDQLVFNNASSANEASAFATGVLTSSANYGAGTDSVTIGTRVYHMVTTPAVDGDVKVGASEAATITNLTHAINNAGGTPGTDYFVLAADPNVTAVAAAHTCTVTAIVEGADANSVATTNVSAGSTASWGAAHLTGGTGETANTMSSLAAQMVTALNGAGVGIAHAAWNNSTQVLTIAGTADNLGADSVIVEVFPPSYQVLSGQVSPADQLPDYDPDAVVSTQRDGVPVAASYAIPGFVLSVTDEGSAGSALTATFVTDTYPVPALVLAAKAQQS